MTDESKHPLRCETCKNQSCRITYCDPGGGEYEFNPHDPIERTASFVCGIALVGCASHSSVTRSSTGPMYLISESELRKFFDAWMFSSKDVRVLHSLMDTIRTRGPVTQQVPSAKPTPLCQKCPLYLVGRGCIHELEYEKTGICIERDTAIAQKTREKILDEVRDACVAAMSNGCDSISGVSLSYILSDIRNSTNGNLKED